MKRRERTRHLIELGGLVLKAGLVDLTDDDRAALYGAFLECAWRLGGDDRDQTVTLWRRRGKRAFASAAPANDASCGVGWSVGSARDDAFAIARVGNVDAGDGCERFGRDHEVGEAGELETAELRFGRCRAPRAR
jgi:hypothetical protein